MENMKVIQTVEIYSDYPQLFSFEEFSRTKSRKGHFLKTHMYYYDNYKFQYHP